LLCACPGKAVIKHNMLPMSIVLYNFSFFSTFSISVDRNRKKQQTKPDRNKNRFIAVSI